MSPKLIIIGGAPATGKSVLADKIQAATGYHHVSKDLLKEHLFDVIEYRDREWSREIGTLVFPLFMGVVEMYLKRGESVIIDNPFVHVDDLAWFEKFVECYKTEIIQIHLIADPAVLRQRFVERANTHRHPGHNDALEEVIEEFDTRWFNKSFIPLPIGKKTKIVNTTDFNAMNHDEILRWIQRLNHYGLKAHRFRTTRMVDAYRKISLQHLVLAVPKVPPRQEVELRVIPDEPNGIAEVRMWFKGTLVGVQMVKYDDLPAVRF